MMCEYCIYVLAATKQLYEWFRPSVCLSVCPSVCPSVCHTFLTMFPSLYYHEIFGNYYQWKKWCSCKGSRSEFKGQGHRCQKPNLATPDHNSSLMMMKWCTKLDAALLFFEVICQISRSYGTKKLSIMSKITRPVAAMKSLRFVLSISERFSRCFVWRNIWVKLLFWVILLTSLVSRLTSHSTEKRPNHPDVRLFAHLLTPPLWATFQYPTIRLIVRSCEVSKSRNW